MMTKAEAESRWCPFALVQSEVKECSFSGNWRDTRITGLVAAYETSGKVIAVAAINRTPSGDPNPDCLCITDKCVFWRKLNGTDGDCSKLDDNMNFRSTEVDPEMEGQWCPNARPENDVVTRPWNGTISGCTNALSSANRVTGNTFHPGSKCITTKCMAYSTNGEKGYCMDADSNMQR
jgi:hypothetical protein